MGKTYRAYLPEQGFSCTAEGWATGCRKITWRISSPTWWKQLDLSAIESVYEEEERRSTTVPSADDDQDLDLWVLMWRVFSSRRIQKKLSEDIGFRVLAAGEPTGFPNESSDFSQVAFEGAARVI